MIEVFSNDEYHVYIDSDALVFTPIRINGRVLLLPPPGVKPQFYSILAVLLVRSGIEVIMPRRHLPCNKSSLTWTINKLLKRYNYDIIIMLGFDLVATNYPKLVIEFSGDSIIRQLVRSNVPGSVHGLPINECTWIKDSIKRADLSIDEELPSLNTIVKIRDLVLNRDLHLVGVSKNN
ncbi:hypothetical protein [Vulcanisaeta sp. JCM 16159]|uniref:hypothetical protein n=1 Tax=Vulcanisaeta sp. JCM 16159 TaxID=1295371 RepID=UPI0006D2419D|nr:hypothetical protein [Vulcanisaeta sp. JCM 16159]